MRKNRSAWFVFRTSFFAILKESLIRWGSNTSIHGMCKVMKLDQPLGFRAFWALCFLVSAAYCAYTLVNSIVNYLHFNVATSIKNIDDWPAQFPMIAFCNLNPIVSASGYAFAAKRGFLSSLASADVNLIMNKTSNIQYSAGREYPSPNDLNFSLSIDQMLLACYFNDKPCNKTDFVEFFDVSYGKCYKFNSGFDSYGNKTDIKTAMYNSFIDGLQLELFVGLQTVQDYLSYQSGVILKICNSSSYPLMNYGAVTAAAGQVTQVAVKRKFFNKLGPPYSKCIANVYSPNAFDSALYRMTFNFTKTYQEVVCTELCFQYTLISNCGCQDLDSLLTPGVRLCKNNTDVRCANKYVGNFASADYIKQNCRPYCPKECLDIQYELTISSSRYPSPFYADYIKNNSSLKSYFNNQSTYDDVANSVLVLNIYYQTLEYAYYSDNPLMTLDILISGVGGYTGLFVGASILTMVEVLEFIVFFILLYMDKLREARKEDMEENKCRVIAESTKESTLGKIVKALESSDLK